MPLPNKIPENVNITENTLSCYNERKWDGVKGGIVYPLGMSGVLIYWIVIILFPKYLYMNYLTVNFKTV